MNQPRIDKIERLISRLQVLKSVAHTDVEVELCYILVDLLDALLTNQI